LVGSGDVEKTATDMARISTLISGVILIWSPSKIDGRHSGISGDRLHHPIYDDERLRFSTVALSGRLVKVREWRQIRGKCLDRACGH
jgi:hypothetical protein